MFDTRFAVQASLKLKVLFCEGEVLHGGVETGSLYIVWPVVELAM